MKPTPATYVLGAVVLVALAGMYVQSFVLGADPVPTILVVIIGIPTVIGAGYAVRTSLPLLRPRPVEVITALAGTMASLLMAREMGIPPLVAAALVAVACGVGALPGGPLDAISAGAGYTGSFVGLLTPNITLGWYWVAVAGVLAGLLWTFVGRSVIQGVGGRMGLVGFMASAAVYWIADLTGHDQNAVLLPGTDGMAHWAVVPIGAAGALITWVLMNRLGWGFNLASGLPSLAVCGVIVASGLGGTGVVLATAFFGGTFVGGTTTARLPNAAWLGAAGLLYGAFMLHFEGPLAGHVGVIGTTGTISVLAIIGIELGWRWSRGRTPAPGSTGAARRY